MIENKTPKSFTCSKKVMYKQEKCTYHIKSALNHFLNKYSHTSFMLFQIQIKKNFRNSEKKEKIELIVVNKKNRGLKKSRKYDLSSFSIQTISPWLTTNEDDNLIIINPNYEMWFQLCGHVDLHTTKFIHFALNRSGTTNPAQ